MPTSLPVEIIFDPSLAAPGAAESILAKLSDFDPILQEIGYLLEEGEMEWFDSYGQGLWSPLAPSTILDKRRKGFSDQPAVVRTGSLRDALIFHDAPGHKFLVTSNSVTIGVDDDVIPYANYQASMRVIVNITADTRERVIRAITDWLGGGMAIEVYAG